MVVIMVSCFLKAIRNVFLSSRVRALIFCLLATCQLNSRSIDLGKIKTGNHLIILVIGTLALYKLSNYLKKSVGRPHTTDLKYSIRSPQSYTVQSNSRSKQRASNSNNQYVDKLIERIRSGELSGDQLTKHDFNVVCHHLKHDYNLERKSDIRLRQELGKAFRKLPGNERSLQESLAQYGSIPASKQTKNFIHEVLRKQGCPSDMLPPIYQLATKQKCSQEYIAGLTGAYCIWIDEKKIHRDKAEFEFTCAHEAGHWFYQHSIEKNFCKENVTEEQHEYEADEFAFLSVADEIRKTVLARARYAIAPYEYINNPNLIATLQPKITRHDCQTNYSLPLPTHEHGQNIATIAQSYPQLA